MSTCSHFPVAGRPRTFRKRASRWFYSQNPLKAILLILLMTQAPGLAPAQQFRKAMFPHHSTGLCLWDRKHVAGVDPPTTIQNEMDRYNSTHGYTGSNAVSMYVDPNDYATPQPMNNWEDWVGVFEGTGPWSSTFWNLVSQYNVIIVKTGYIATQVMDNPSYSLSVYQGQWRRIITVMAQHRDKFFVITTNYPSCASHGDFDQQSNLFAKWAKNTLATGNDSYGSFPPNVFVLDWFHYVASYDDGHCDDTYGSANDTDPYSPGGDHPSNAAVAVIDPQFVSDVFNAAIAYEGTPLATTWAGPPSLTEILGNRVQVEWETLSETNTYRFYVQRKGQMWQTIDSVNAGGTSLSKRHYAVTDSNVTAGTWIYRIQEVDLNGSVHYSQEVSTTLTLLANASNPLVTAYALEQNYPNPFNPSTTIRFELPNAADVRLTVFNVLGQEMATLVNENKPAGTYTVQFDGSRLASGLYFYRLQAGPYVEMKKLVLLR